MYDCRTSYVFDLLLYQYVKGKSGGIMKTTLNIPNDLIDKTMRLSGCKTKTEAIVIALKEYVRRKKLDHIVKMEGILQFSDDLEKVRHER
jgi:Arc/MetJ family transcription regulator